MTAKEISVRAEFENLGFNEEDTGGGCTAWVMTLSHGRECMVTNDHAAAVLDYEEPAELGVYLSGYGAQLCSMSFSNTRTLLDWIDALCGDGESAATALERWAGGQ